MRPVTATAFVKSYGSGRAARRVLDGTDIHIDAGEVVALVGPSGYGNSTLLPATTIAIWATPTRATTA